MDNFDELQNELVSIESDLEELKEEEQGLLELVRIERRKIAELNQNLDVIKQDIANNKDANRLKKLGSDLQCHSFEGICPTCSQRIQDSLLPIHHQGNMMTIEQTINHLNAQKEMLEFALKYHRNRLVELDGNIQELRGKIGTLYRLAKSIRRDLYSVDDDLSETIIYKRMSIEHHISELGEFKNIVYDIVNRFMELSNKWQKLLKEKASLPKQGFTEKDEKRLQDFKANFISNLRQFRYTSTSNLGGIEISKDNYLPVIDNFDMKFDSSASDNIRAIWSYTLALLQTSVKYCGNHPGLIIFDEPTQHSIGADDATAFFNSIVGLNGDKQIIIGITVNTEEIKSAIKNLDDNDYKYIHIGEKAFV